MASTYVAGGDVEYGRYGNPTWSAFEQALGDLEGGRCLAFASGPRRGRDDPRPRRAGRQGGRAAARLQRQHHADGRPRGPRTDHRRARRHHRHRRGRRRPATDAALVWLESPTNPALEVADIPPIVAAAHEAGAYVVVDNTFATPLLQQPLSLDADLVVHSATKFIAGHSDVLLGAVVTARRPAVRRAEEASRHGRRDAGDVRDLAGAARAAHPARAARARAGQRPGAGAAARRAPGRRRGPLPRLRRDRRPSCSPRARWPRTC